MSLEAGRRSRLVGVLRVVLPAVLLACRGVPEGEPRFPGSGSPSSAYAPASEASSSPPPVAPVDAPELGQAPVGPTESAVVLRVIDGDTVEVDRGRGPERVRYIGVDTPETVHPDQAVGFMGPEASAYNASLVDGETVLLEREESDTDRYGRLLRHVWIAVPERPEVFRHVGLALLGTGHARAVGYPPDDAYASVFAVAEATAREAGVGVWGTQPSPPAAANSPTTTTGRSPHRPSAPHDDCHPSYVPCLPTVDDLNCAEVRALGADPVQVVGPDDYDLDRDDDGWGCDR